MPNCKTCHEEFKAYGNKVFCSYACRYIKVNCIQCGSEFRTSIYTPNSRFCSKKCFAVSDSGKKSSESLVNYVRSDLGRNRMKNNNPMSILAIREKMRQKLLGRTFLSRGGNGQLTRQQIKLMDILRLPVEYPIKLSMAKTIFQSVPKNYKVDLAVVDNKIAIEVDGKSHRQKKWKFLDRRKTEILEYIGWSVIRFKNEEVDSNIKGVLTSLKPYLKDCSICNLKVRGL